MKKLFPTLVAALVSLSAFAVDPSVKQYYELLTPENKAKADLGKISKIVIVDGAAKQTKKRFTSTSSNSVGTSTHALVDGRSCYGTLYVEDVNYSTTKDCNGNPTTYMNNANIAVDIQYRTFAYDYTRVEVNLFAQSRNSTSSALLLVTDILDVQSDSAGYGDTTVVYVVEAQYANTYDIFADVYLDDERGTACIIETNSAVIQ